MASETFGFTEVTAGRTVGIGTAADSSALLGIEGTEAGTTPTFTNNSDDFRMEVTLSSTDDIEFDVDGDGEYEEPVIFDLDPGQRREVEIQGRDDTAIVEVEVGLFNGTKKVGEIQLDRTFDIPQASAISDVEGSVRNVGGSGKYEFRLENTQFEGGQTVEIDGISVDWVDSPATQVGGHNDEILVLETTEEQIVQEVIEVGGGIVDFVRPSNDDVVELEPNGDGQGNEKEFEFDRFRTGDGGGTLTRTEEVDITLRAADGSMAQIELR
ncbi:hypothetical protein OB919_07825 [Halobacteria archaeon AArc-curdl1]|uniref:Uncharacterized protein n=1 Tax=Natronosalvus hydrolyticus TaxID=2979988 RepID=A0AAP2Z8B3_9EURY|nr:hypothetical protein [Halobacteria archaeon AArc-curdl1]